MTGKKTSKKQHAEKVKRNKKKWQRLVEAHVIDASAATKPRPSKHVNHSRHALTAGRERHIVRLTLIIKLKNLSNIR